MKKICRGKMKSALEKFGHVLVPELIWWFPTICFAANYEEGAQCSQYIKIMAGAGSEQYNASTLNCNELHISAIVHSAPVQCSKVQCVVHCWYN